MSKTLIVRSDLDNRQLLCNFIYVTCLVQDACREAHRLRQDDNKRLFDAFIDCIKEFIPLRDGLQREILSRMNNKSKPSGLTIRPDKILT